MSIPLSRGKSNTSSVASSPSESSRHRLNSGSSGAGGKSKTRKKVAKACLACQKSHLTCDEQRPCTRCVKKGIGEKCVEGVRKKAKYLLEGDERTAPSRPRRHATPPSHPPGDSISPVATTTATNFSLPSLSMPPESAFDPQPPLIPQPSYVAPTKQNVPDDIWLAGPMNDTETADSQPWNDNFLTGPNASFGGGNADTGGLDLTLPSSPFGFSAAANEFQMFDAMFGTMSPTLKSFAESISGPTPPGPNNNLPTSGSGSLLLDTNPMDTANFSNWTNTEQNVPNPTSFPSNTSPTTFNSYQPQNANQTQAQPPATYANQSGAVTKTDGMKTPPFLGDWQLGFGVGGLLRDKTKDSSGNQTGAPLKEPNRKMTSSEVYSSALKPYDYTEGYHILMEFLTKHFEQKEILRVVHALASFRPSLIALQMGMSEDDEVFIERSFQRTMIELEKLISYSATPTAIWRRTGEICYANPEFCQLARKSDTEVYGNKNYIYRLFAKTSVVEYWENFSVHAFENTTQNFFQSTTLDIDNTPVECSCCFTIRRDVFDLPSVVIGQFLPVPKET